MRDVPAFKRNSRSHAELMEETRTAGMQGSSSSEEPPISTQQSTTDCVCPRSLVSLYLLFISLAVWASAITVSSKLTRCLDAISLLAIASAVQALTAPKAHRSMQGTCT